MIKSILINLCYNNNNNINLLMTTAHRPTFRPAIGGSE